MQLSEEQIIEIGMRHFREGHSPTAIPNSVQVTQFARAIESALSSQAEREAAQRERMNERFANRPKTAATADFDLPAPNDAPEQQAEPVADERAIAYLSPDRKRVHWLLPAPELEPEMAHWVAHWDDLVVRAAQSAQQQAEPKCDDCKDTGQICVGTSGLESDGNAPLLERCPSCGYGEQQAEPGADERAAFEAWALKTSDGNCCEEDLQRWGSNDGDLAGQYVNALVERDWLVWQARAARSGQRAGVADGWQPIETAPKTGRTLLLGYPNSLGNWRTTRGQWMSDEYIAEYWEEPDNGEAGWFETSVEADDVPSCWRIAPTHWMPLPAAPTQQQEGDQ